ncbi:MAG: zinc-ribbon domain-containing protein [Promethearchaeota archaeon]
MTQKCSHCGATLKQSAKFCTICGTPTRGGRAAPPPVPTPQAKPDLLKCSNCGTTLKKGMKFCTKCGNRVEPTATPITSTSASNVCTLCGFSNNPESSNYCINCGQVLSTPAPETQELETQKSASVKTTSVVTCPSCGRNSRPGSKFCIYCGSDIPGTAKTPEQVADETPYPATATARISTVEPITVPTKVLASLMARGRQLVLEEEYANNGSVSDKLLEELSQAAADSDFELEELIDSYINERGELERLEDLHKKAEVSERVYDRLTKEYEEKLEGMDEQIKNGVLQLQGYQAQVQLDHAEVKEELDTLNARLLIGDEDAEVNEKRKTTLTEKADRLHYALLACEHILKKESAMRNGPITRFEVKETTVADSKLSPSISDEEVEVIESTEAPEEPESVTETPKSRQQDAEAGKICANCGRVTASDARFCVHCGAPL